jgi:hypothetical protein
MAGLLLLVSAIGGVLVADLVLENPSAWEAIVVSQLVSGSRQGVLLAMTAALGSVVALLLVASMTSTRAPNAKRLRLLGSSLACWMGGSAAT